MLKPSDGPAIHFKPPCAEDGLPVHNLIAACPPLDTNSCYANLLQCTHFSETCVCAELNGELVGWVSAYLQPQARDCLFVWQIAVGEQARGRGLGVQLLNELLSRPACQHIRRIETTITAENSASWALFEKLAEAHGATLTRSELFDSNTHFGGEHDSELLCTIELPS